MLQTKADTLESKKCRKRGVLSSATSSLD